MTLPDRKRYLKAVVADQAQEMCRQIEAAADDAALDEIAGRIAAMSQLETKTENTHD